MYISFVKNMKQHKPSTLTSGTFLLQAHDQAVTGLSLHATGNILCFAVCEVYFMSMGLFISRLTWIAGQILFSVHV